MNKLLSLMVCCVASAAFAHVGIVNTQTPYAVAGRNYELVLSVPHGCTYTTSSGTTSAADTWKVEVVIPAGFLGARPILDGVFGKPTLTKDENGMVTAITWEKGTAFDSSADDQVHRVAVRSTAPNAPFTTARFNVKQFCRHPEGGEELVVDWANYGTPATNESPAVKIVPARTPGWNRYLMTPANELHSAQEVKDFLAAYFSDAQIVWLQAPGGPRGGFSVNPATTTRIQAQAAGDASFFAVADQTELMLHANDTLWVRF